MTTYNKTTEEERYFAVPDQVGDLAESARRHLAYLALAEQIATSENALQQLLNTLSRVGQTEKNNAEPDDADLESDAMQKSSIVYNKVLHE